MKSHSFQIELLGGPADGLQLAAHEAPSRTIRMPSSPAPRLDDGFGRRGAAGRHWAMYELLWRKCKLDSGRVAVVHLGYNFVGCRASREVSPKMRFAARLLQIVGLLWRTQSTGGWRKRLAARKTIARTKVLAGFAAGGHFARYAKAVEKQTRLRHP